MRCEPVCFFSDAPRPEPDSWRSSRSSVKPEFRRWIKQEASEDAEFMRAGNGSRRRIRFTLRGNDRAPRISSPMLIFSTFSVSSCSFTATFRLNRDRALEFHAEARSECGDSNREHSSGSGSSTLIRRLKHAQPCSMPAPRPPRRREKSAPAFSGLKTNRRLRVFRDSAISERPLGHAKKPLGRTPRTF